MRIGFSTTLRATVLWLLVIPSGAEAAEGRWTSQGPSGGSMQAVRFDPLDARILYAVTSAGGIFKSMDGGETWRSSSRGLETQEVLDVAVDPLRHETVFATTSETIYRSLDGGESWAALGPQAPGRGVYGGRLAFDPTRPSDLYVGGWEGLFQSADGGESFREVGSFNMC